MATRTPQAGRTPPRYRVSPNYARWSEPLPYPATTLVIAQHFFLSHCERYWAWLIAGSFYDGHDEVLWRAEVFMAMNPGEEDDGEEVGDGEGDELAEGETDGYHAEEHEEESGYGLETFVSDSDSGAASSWLGDDSEDDGEESARDSRYARDDILRSHARNRLYRDPRARITQHTHAQAQRSPPPDTYPSLQPPYRRLAPGIYSPPPNWDPTRQGAVPGHWNAAYDDTLGWVNYFQPRTEN